LNQTAQEAEKAFYYGSVNEKALVSGEAADWVKMVERR
jgi:hypothetical protein